MRIVITGAGVVSAIGLDKASTAASLLEGRSGIGPLKHLRTVHSDLPCGEVDLSDEQMKSLLGIPSGTPVPRTSLLGMMAVKEALDQAGILHPGTSEETEGRRVGLNTGRVYLINGTTVGGMDITERTYPKIDTSLHDCGASSDIIAKYFGCFGQVTTISTACSSAANAIAFGAELIRDGRADLVVAGGSESLSKYHLNGFNTLMILDSEQCRPFDATRAGLNLGEGAGFVVLESEEHAKARKAEVLAILSGYGNACDAFHQTATSPEGIGATLAMRQALATAGLMPSEIDYINAHGTGTPNNDATESAALRSVFGDALPPVSSTKSFTGHTTSASGGIETVFCLLAMQQGFLPANLGWSQPDPDCIQPISLGCCADGSSGHTLPPRTRPTQKAPSAQLRNILCNSFGFGGNDSALVISAPDAKTPDSEIPAPGIKVVVRSAVYLEGADFEWKHLLNPMQARRLGTLMKRTLVSSLEALRNAGQNQDGGEDSSQTVAPDTGAPVIPDAVITATGLGCMENSEKFLAAMLDSGETMMSPTDFMQSTHNTPGSLISIHLKDHGYNTTYSQGECSLASALMDAFIQLKSGRIRTALVGSHDELTPATSEYPVPDGSLALLLEAVPEDNFGKAGNDAQLPVIEDIRSIAPVCARNLYDAIGRLQKTEGNKEENCGPVYLKRYD